MLSGVLPHAERRLASCRAASCLMPSGVLPHAEAMSQPTNIWEVARAIIDMATSEIDTQKGRA
jgi:hypothetical protein